MTILNDNSNQTAQPTFHKNFELRRRFKRQKEEGYETWISFQAKNKGKIREYF